MSVFGIFTPFQWIVLGFLALIFVAMVVIIVMLRRRGNTSDEQHDKTLEWVIYTADQLKDLDPQARVDDAVKEILEEVRARASIVTARFEGQQQASLTAFTRAAGEELERFRQHAQRAIGQETPKYTFRQPPHGLPATTPQQPRVLTSSAPQQALAPASPVWQAPGNSAQGSGQATGYFAHNGSVATGGNGLALIEKPQAEAGDPSYSAGYDDAAPEETAPGFEREFEPEAGSQPEQATVPEMEDEPEPAPEPVSEVAEPEHTSQTSDDKVADPPQADKEPVAEAAQPAEPAGWNAEATLSKLPIAAAVLASISSRFPGTETGMKSVDPTQPEAPAATDPTATDQHGTNGSPE